MVHILHLSDLHLCSKEDAKIFHCQLKADLQNELDIDRIAYLIISGDVADKSIPDEYNAALNFINDIKRDLSIDSPNIIIVPGNHDLNWDLSKESYKFIYNDKKPDTLPEGKYISAGEQGILLRNDSLYQRRFDNFSKHFYKEVYKAPYPINCEEQAILYTYPGDRILFLALNSAFEIDHYFSNRSGINMVAFAHALRKISKNNYEDWLKIAVCHHPVSGPDMMKDIEFMEQLSVHGFKLLMHGHIHEAMSWCFRDYDDRNGIHVIGAGTFGSPAQGQVPGIPLQYNLLAFDPEEQTITVKTRKKERPHGAWSADARWGDRNDPKPEYHINLSIPDESAEVHAPVIKRPLEIPQVYKNWLIDHCQRMDTDKLMEKGRVVTIELPEIFIPLYANPPVKKTNDAKNENREKQVQGPDRLLEDKERSVDIEELIFQNSYLLIEGQAGSGKTTLMKHLSYTTIKEEAQRDGNALLPVLVFLKDLKNFNYAQERLHANATAAEKILTWYFEHTENGLDIDLVKGFCTAGRALFLSDGLDEIESGLRDLVAESFADFRNKFESCRMVFSGRPHGFEGLIAKRFGDRHVRILPFTMEQVEGFIRKWFCSIYTQDSRIGKKTAEDMLSEVREHPGVERLIDNPLMLTAICILYLDGRELPGQRAELYKKVVDNLLYKRFRDKSEKVRQFLNTLALTMHTKGVRGIDRKPAVEILGRVYKAREGEPEEEYKRRLDTLFDRIEPGCGLLKREAGEYSFRHLTFQELLTATAIIDKETDYLNAVKDYWGLDRYKEVIEIYIGYLSIDNKGWANKIVKDALFKEDKAPFNRWRLAARSMIDINRDRREADVVALAQRRMLRIFDSVVDPKSRADAGEILGWLGDTRNLKEFVKIEGGVYTLSTGKIEIEQFEIGKYPVTNQWFEEFILDKGYDTVSYWSAEGRKWLAHTKARNPRFWHDRQWRCPNAPVVGVCWYEAYAFTRWLTEKLKDGYR